MSTASDLLQNYQHVVKSLTFTTGSKGIFNVTVDGELLYSKAVTGRHAESGEVLQLFTEKYGQGVIRYGQN
ncbi:MAG: Rdx family protein [Actinobacteria bacterium]|nr:Rdx family protein [Actinomycetota bacterium]